MPTYKITRRFFRDEHRPKVMATGLTLDEARAWCRDPETSSSTCQHYDNVRITEFYGPWFDGYEEE